MNTTNAMATAFFQWKSAIYNENWHEIPKHEDDFLINLQEFEKVWRSFSTFTRNGKRNSDRKK